MAPVHVRVRTTVKLLHRDTTAPNLWLLNIPDFSLVDYRILAMLQEWVCPVRHVDKLRQTDSRLSKQLIGSDLG